MLQQVNFIECSHNSLLPPRLSELAILITGRHWESQYGARRDEYLAA
jgi:hypothetical protein